MKALEADKIVLEAVLQELTDPDWVMTVAMDGLDDKYFNKSDKFIKSSTKLAQRLVKVLARTNAKLEKLNADRGE